MIASRRKIKGLGGCYLRAAVTPWLILGEPRAPYWHCTGTREILIESYNLLMMRYFCPKLNCVRRLARDMHTLSA